MHFANECLLIGLLRTLDISFASLPWHDTSCDKSEIECLQSYLVYGKDHPINKGLYGRDGDSPNDAQRESAGIAAAPDATDAKLPGVSTRAAGAIDAARESAEDADAMPDAGEALMQEVAEKAEPLDLVIDDPHPLKHDCC